MVRTASLSSKRQRTTSSSSTGSPVPNLLAAITVLDNIVIRPPNNAGAPVDGEELQLPYLGQAGASNSITPSLPVIEVADIDFYVPDPVLDQMFADMERAAMEAIASSSNTHVGAEVEANATNTAQGYHGVTEVKDSVEVESLPIVSTQATSFDGYDSAEEFQPKVFKGRSSASKLPKGKAKVKATQRGIIKRATVKGRRVVESAATPSTSTRTTSAKPIKGPNNESLLLKLLAEPTTLPAKSKPKNQVVASSKKQVKSRLGLGTVLPPPPPAPVATSPVLHAIEDSDVEPEVFSQTSENVIDAYRHLLQRVSNQNVEDLANVRRSEEALARADEAIRLAQEERRVVFERLEGHRRALENSTKKLRYLDRR